MMAEKDVSSSAESTTDQAARLTAAGATLTTEAEADSTTEKMKNATADEPLKGETIDASHQPPQQQQKLSSEAFEQFPLLAEGSVEQLKVGSDRTETQATGSEESVGVGALSDTNDGLENLVVSGQPTDAASPTETSSPSTKMGPLPCDETKVARTDGAAGSSKVVNHAAVSGESYSAQAFSKQPTRRESVVGDCETQLSTMEGRGSESPEDVGIGRRRSDTIDSTTPRVGGIHADEEGSGQLAALQDEEQPEGVCQPVCVPAVHTASSGSANGLNDQQPPIGIDPPQYTSCFESSQVNAAAEELHAPSPTDGGSGRVLLVSGDARKLTEEVISSSLMAVAAAVRAIPRHEYCQPDPVADANRVPIQKSSQVLPSRGHFDFEKEASPVEPAEYLSASVRGAVANSFLAGVFDIVSALRAAAEAKVPPPAAPPPAVEEMPKDASDSATVILQQQSSPIEHEGTEKTDQLDITEEVLVPPVPGSAAPEGTCSVDSKRVAVEDGVAVDGGVEDDARMRLVPTDGHSNPPSSASLRAYVVQDYMSDTCGTIVASEAAAAAVEVPPDISPATETLSKEPVPTRNEATFGTIRLDKTEGNISPASNALAAERESLVEPTTGVGDERPPTGETKVVVDGGEEEDARMRLVPADGYPSPPSSASLRANVVQDYMSDTCGTIVASEAAAAAVEVPPDISTETLSEEPVPTRNKATDGTIRLDKTEGTISPASNALAAECESLVEPTTGVGDERPPTGETKVVVDGGEEEEEAMRPVPTDGYPSPPSSASLRANVVQDYMSDTCGTIVASEAAAAAVEVPPDISPATETLSKEPVPTRNEATFGTIRLDKTEGNISPASNALAAERESLVEPTTGVGDERPPTGETKVVVDGGEEEEEAMRPVPTDGYPSPPSSASLRANVVQDYMSDTCGTIVASEAAAAAVEVPPDISPATETLSKEPVPTRDEATDGIIRFDDKTEDHVPPVPDTPTSESGSLVEPTTGVGDERPPTSESEPLVEPATGAGNEKPPTGGDVMANCEKQVRDAPSSPSPPSSASLRGSVVSDFLSGVYGTVATTEARAAEAPPAPDEHIGSVPALTEDPATGVVDSSRERIESSSLEFLDAHQSEQQQQPTTTTQQLENEAVREGGVQHQAAVTARSGCTSPRSMPDESLHVVVVGDYLSQTLSGILSAEAGGVEAAMGAKRDQVTPDKHPYRDPGDAARTVAAGNVQPGDSEAMREDAAAVQAMRNSIVETMTAVNEQGSTSSPGNACTGRAADARGGLCSSTPPGTPEEERHGHDASPEFDPEVPAEPELADGGHPSNPRCVEASAYLAKAGARAKLLGEASDKAKHEAAAWLSLAGATAQTAQDNADKARADASSWLRDTGARALSLKGGGEGKRQEEAAAWLRLVGTRAKTAQDCADEARVDASSWLRDKGSRALSLQGTEQAGRLECAAWLRLAGGRAKSAQARAEGARTEAVSWLRDAGGKAVSRQERAAGARLDAAAWLATKGASELERTASSSAEGSAAAATAAATTTAELQGDFDGGERVGECSSLHAGNNVGKDPAEGSEGLRAEESTAQGDSDSSRLGSSQAVRGSPRADKPTSATVAEDVRAGQTEAGLVPHSPRNDEGLGEHLAGDNGNGNDNDNDNDNDNVAPGSGAGGGGAPTPPCQSVSPVGSRVHATAATGAAADADADAADDVKHAVGRTASTYREAPAPWLEPATTPLARRGSFAPTAAGAEDFGRMLDVGEAEWSRVSLTRTPPFDALNSPSLPVRHAPVRRRPRPLHQSGSEGFGLGGPFGAVDDTGAAAAGTAFNPDGSQPMGFFAPPNQMAPKGEAYRDSDSFRSADASVGTTARADSAGSFFPGSAAHSASGGTDGNFVSGNVRAWRRSGGGATSEESWGGGLGEVHSPVGEAKSRIMCRAAGGGGAGRWQEAPEVLSSAFPRSVRATGEGVSGRRRWHKQAEQSRRYMRRWETFLGRAHRHFVSEADVRKRMSAVRRAHPDVSNEVAFVALAQSRGRSSEAAAVLHLPRAKDEAALVTMMLDVSAFVALAREAAETRRRSRQLEKHRRMMMAARGPPQHRSPEGERLHALEQEQDERERQLQLRRHGCEQQQQRQQQQQPQPWPGADSSFSPFEGDVHAAERAVVVAEIADNRRHQPRRRHQRPHPWVESNGGSRGGGLQSRGSDSAPSLLPPIEGRLTEGTPPSPSSLRAVLSTSTSVAVEVPRGFGLVPEVERAPNGGERFRALEPKKDRRELRAMLRARARWQRQRMAEMAVPGEQQQQLRGGSGLDALTERFFREARTLDRDSENLDDRIRGRRQRKNNTKFSSKRRNREDWRDSDQSGAAAAGVSTGGGSNNDTATT